MRRGRSVERGKLIAGALALVVIAIAVFVAFSRDLPFSHHYEIKIRTADSGELRRGSPVRIAGVNVGEVTDIKPGKDGVTVITARIGDHGRPVHADARAKIRQRIALEGNEFIDLQPGSPSAPEIKDGGSIPERNTAAPVQLDQVLGALDRGTRDNLVTLLGEYGKAISGKGGQGYNRSVPYWKQAYRGSAVVNQALQGTRLHDLSSYVRSGSIVADALDRDPQALRSLVTDFDTTAQALADERGALGSAVEELPGTLATGRVALADVSAALPHVDALVHDMRPAVRNAPSTIDATRPFLHQLRLLARPQELRGLAHALPPTIGALASLERRLVPLFRQVRLASSCQDRVILPWSRSTVPDDDFPSTGPIYKEAVRGTLPGLAGESRSGDANGQWFTPVAIGGPNVIALGDGKFAATALPANGVNPRQPEMRPPLRQNVPCETQQKPDLRSLRADPPPQFQAPIDTPEAKARYLKAREVAIDYARKQLKAQGLADTLKIGDTDLTLTELRSLPPVTPGALNGMIGKKR